MLDFLFGILDLFARAIAFVLDVWVSVSRLRQFATIAITGRPDTDPRIEIPPDPKSLSPAAERARAEAEARRDHQSKAIAAIGGDPKRRLPT